jgi:hypothetical protein
MFGTIVTGLISIAFLGLLGLYKIGKSPFAD